MKSFRFRITCWIALVFFALMFVVLIAFITYAVHEVAHQSKKRMKLISKSILEEVASHMTADGQVGPEAFASVNERLSFVDREQALAYAVVSKDHVVLYRTPDFTIPLNEGLIARKRDRIFLHSVRSGERIDDLFREWHFLLRYERNGTIVFMTDRTQYELSEHFLTGFAVTVVLALIMAVPVGFLLSRRILTPLSAIDASVKRIRNGDLDARIPELKSDDEIGHLIAALNLTFTELQASLDRITQFSADAAHEVNTPLTALRGDLEVCLRTERTAEEYQTVIAESIERVASLSRLVKDLLLLADPRDGRLGRHFAPVDFSDLLRTTAAQLQFFADEAAIQVECDIEPSMEIVGDASLLQRLAYNLIHNAIRFSPPNSVVTVRLCRKGKATVLAVKDDGIGIGPGDQARIFERFYQVDKGRGSGTGLGLSIVRWITDVHNAKIDVISKPGEGALFHVTWPDSAASDHDTARFSRSVDRSTRAR